MPHPRPISSEVAGIICLTQSTNKTGAVFSSVTAKVAPVSLTLLVKTMTAPAIYEYLVKGKMMVLNTVKGLPPNVLAASSLSMFTLSMAATIDLTR